MVDNLQKYYIELRKTLSVRANHILGVGGFEKATDVLYRLTDKKKILLLRKCGFTTMEELYEMVCKLREYNDSLNKTNENDTDDNQSRKDIQELLLSEVKFIQGQYEKLLNRLSVRTQNIAKAHGLLYWIQFEPYLNSSEEDFLQYRNCGKLSAQEFLTLASELQIIIDEVCISKRNNASMNKTNENNTEDIQSRKDIQELPLLEVKFIQRQYEQLLNRLSVRTQNIAKAQGLLYWIQFEPYLNSSEEDFLQYRNCGKLSAQEFLTLASELQNIIDEVCGLHKYNDSLIETNENKTETTQRQMTIQELPLSEVKFIQRQYEQLINRLSVRTQNIAKTNGLLQWKKFEPYLNSTESDFLQYRNCGKKSAQEFLKLAFELQKIIHESISRTSYRIDDTFPFMETIHLTAIEEGFLSFFHKKCNHWPMVFLSGKCIQSVFSVQELMVTDGKESNIPKQLMALSKTRLQQIINTASEKTRNSPLLKELRIHPDWKYYDINIIPPFCDSLNRYSIFDRKVEMENGVMRDFISELQSNEYLQNDNTFSDYCSINKTFLFQIHGLTCYYANLEKKRIYPYYSFPQNVHFSFYIDIKYTPFRYNKALSEVCRLMKVKTEEDILIPIVSYFIDNNYYWDDTFSHSDEDRRNMKGILVELFQRICNAEIQNESLFIRANIMDYSNQLYEILQDAGERLDKEELLRQLKQRSQEKGVSCSFTDSARLTPYLTKDPRIVSIGKSGFWGLKEWEDGAGSIREISIQIVKKAIQPIQINDLIKLVIKRRPDSNENSISSIIRQTASSGELLLFYNDFIGYPQKKYIGEYTLMPKTFEDWLLAFREFVIKNKRFPYSTEDGYEGYLYRWFYRASQLTELTSDEILKIDALGKELSNYPHNATEYSFLQKCDLFKKFVEGNKRMLTKEDDVELFSWFYKSSRNYSTLNDNREKYFSQLLQYISNILY